MFGPPSIAQPPIQRHSATSEQLFPRLCGGRCHDPLSPGSAGEMHTIPSPPGSAGGDAEACPCVGRGQRGVPAGPAQPVVQKAPPTRYPDPMDRAYLDHAATTPLDPRVLDAMLPRPAQRLGQPLPASTARPRRPTACSTTRATPSPPASNAPPARSSSPPAAPNPTTSPSAASPAAAATPAAT